MFSSTAIKSSFKHDCDSEGGLDLPYLKVMMLGCLSLRRCLISVSLMSRTFFTATSSPWNLPRKTAPCAPLPTHCKSEISSKGTSQDSGCTAATRNKAIEQMWMKCFATLQQMCTHQGKYFNYADYTMWTICLSSSLQKSGRFAEQTLGSCYILKPPDRTQLESTGRQACSNKWQYW